MIPSLTGNKKQLINPGLQHHSHHHIAIPTIPTATQPHNRHSAASNCARAGPRWISLNLPLSPWVLMYVLISAVVWAEESRRKCDPAKLNKRNKTNAAVISSRAYDVSPTGHCPVLYSMRRCCIFPSERGPHSLDLQASTKRPRNASFAISYRHLSVSLRSPFALLLCFRPFSTPLLPVNGCVRPGRVFAFLGSEIAREAE